MYIVYTWTLNSLKYFRNFLNGYIRRTCYLNSLESIRKSINNNWISNLIKLRRGWKIWRVNNWIRNIIIRIGWKIRRGCWKIRRRIKRGIKRGIKRKSINRLGNSNINWG
jgi:hypothetical protein